MLQVFLGVLSALGVGLLVALFWSMPGIIARYRAVPVTSPAEDVDVKWDRALSVRYRFFQKPVGRRWSWVVGTLDFDLTAPPGDPSLGLSDYGSLDWALVSYEDLMTLDVAKCLYILVSPDGRRALFMAYTRLSPEFLSEYRLGYPVTAASLRKVDGRSASLFWMLLVGRCFELRLTHEPPGRWGWAYVVSGDDYKFLMGPGCGGYRGPVVRAPFLKRGWIAVKPLFGLK